MAIPLDRLVGQKMDAYRGNPQGLQQRYQQNQQLLDLLALQKLKTEKDAAKRELALAEKPKKTMLEQLEGEHLKRTKDEMVEQTAGVMQQQQAKQQSNLQRTAQGAVPPPQAAAQGAVPPPQVANTGIASAPRPQMRMAQGGVIGFQSGKEVNVPPDKILERMGLTREKWLGLTEEMQGAYLKDFPALSAEASPLRRDITGIGDYLDRAGLEEQRRVEAQAPAAGWRVAKEYLFGTQESLAKQQAAADAGRKKAAQIQSEGSAPASAAPAMAPTAQDIQNQMGGGPLTKEQAFPTLPPKPPATTPATTPVVRQNLLPTGKAGQVKSLGVTPELLKATQSQPDGAAPEKAVFPTAPAQADVLKRAKERADIKPEDAFRKASERGLKALERPDEVRQREKERQAEAANLLAQQQDPNKLRNERLSRLLQEGARTGTPGGASAGFSAAQREQEEAARTGLASIHKTERTDEALDTVVREKVYAGAKTAYEKADENIAKGIEVMAGISRDQQTNLTAEAKAMIESKDKRLGRILRAGLAEASMGMQADIANLVASTAKQRRDLDAAMKKLDIGRLSRNDAEIALVRSNKAMADIKEKNAKNFQKEEETLRYRPEFQDADNAGKQKLIADLYLRRDTMLGVLLEGMPAQSKRLAERIKTLDRGPAVSKRQI